MFGNGSYNRYVYVRFTSVLSKMAASEKAVAQSVSYGLSRVGKPEFTLKAQQLEAVRHVYVTSTRGKMFSCGSQLASVSRCVTRCCPL